MIAKSIHKMIWRATFQVMSVQQLHQSFTAVASLKVLDTLFVSSIIQHKVHRGASIEVYFLGHLWYAEKCKLDLVSCQEILFIYFWLNFSFSILLSNKWLIPAHLWLHKLYSCCSLVLPFGITPNCDFCKDSFACDLCTATSGGMASSIFDLWPAMSGGIAGAVLFPGRACYVFVLQLNRSVCVALISVMPRCISSAGLL